MDLDALLHQPLRTQIAAFLAGAAAPLSASSNACSMYLTATWSRI